MMSRPEILIIFIVATFGYNFGKFVSFVLLPLFHFDVDFASGNIAIVLQATPN